MKNTIILVLASWLLIYLMLCVSYVSALNPFQWIVDFSDYPEPLRNGIVFCALPLWVLLCNLSCRIDEFGVSDKIDGIWRYILTYIDLYLNRGGK